MAWLLIPSSDRPAARRVISRIDAMLGYPRQHAASELTRLGAGIHASIVRTETQAMVLLHDATGALVLHGAIAIHVDAVVDAMRERFVDLDGVRMRIREWIAVRAWEVRATLPGVDTAWSSVTPRDGAAGSADGEPIPEGSE